MSNGRLQIISTEQSAASSRVEPVRAAGTPRSDVFAGNVALVTLGCAKNIVDSEVMLGALVSKGFRPIDDPANADLIVVNTCAFLESAVKEGIDTILALAGHKKNGRCRRLVVAGCMVERYRKELAQEFPEVDRFISTDELLSVADESSTTVECFDDARRPYFLYDEAMVRVNSSSAHQTYVKISEGCNRPCSFCIIPKIRGSFRSRPIESVVGEIRQGIAAGVRDFNFVAQDLTAYGIDFPEGRGVNSQLTKLLEAIGEEYNPNNPFWLRLLYAYPVGVTEELIRFIKDAPFVCNYLDLPLQHISHDVLKNMRRPLGEKGTRALIEKIRAIAPEIALRTTFIVGFPGETDSDIQALVNFVGEGHFAHVGVFTYSQESEALAFNFPGQLPQHEKEQRRALIMRCQQANVERRLEQFIGKQLRVIIDGAHADTELLISSRSEWQGPETDGEVIINEVDEHLLAQYGDLKLSTSLRGRFGVVEITEIHGYDLTGRLVEVG